LVTAEAAWAPRPSRCPSTSFGSRGICSIASRTASRALAGSWSTSPATSSLRTASETKRTPSAPSRMMKVAIIATGPISSTTTANVISPAASPRLPRRRALSHCWTGQSIPANTAARKSSLTTGMITSPSRTVAITMSARKKRGSGCSAM
jgi:hypothetical protein